MQLEKSLTHDDDVIEEVIGDSSPRYLMMNTRGGRQVSAGLLELVSREETGVYTNINEAP